MANKINLNIPETIITNSKSELSKFAKNKIAVIVKPITEIFGWIEEKEIMGQFVKLLDDDDILEMPDVFFPSLFQNFIDKKYEIRSFIIGEKIFSMCQINKSIDVRRPSNKLRNVPFLLSEKYTQKLFTLFKELGCETGSVDTIISSSGEEIFLEVNINGQFERMSKMCNFYLEREIAKYLTSERKSN